MTMLIPTETKPEAERLPAVPDHLPEDAATVRREWTLVAVGLTALLAVLAVVLGVFGIAGGDSTEPAATKTVVEKTEAAPAAAAPAAAPTLEDAKGVRFEPFERVDPTLPAIPAGEVKKFDVDVYQHVTQVDEKLAPTEVWSYSVNGVEHRGTGVSAPMVVTEGDLVDFKLTNGSATSMKVDLPHSLDFHSAEVNPGKRYSDLGPGESMTYRFRADHPGVFMYHCATQPVLMHTGAGMVGMFVVKPKDLAPVDKELWITQQEFYIGKPGGDADMAKMAAKQPDVIAFNGYGNQYAAEPIPVKKDERVRMYVLNAGPSVWSAFHVIGTVFDKTMVEGTPGAHAQTINLAPSQGGWVEFDVEEEGTYPFVNHAFGDMVKGSMGVLATPNAPKSAGHGAPAPAEGKGHDHATDHGAAAAKADLNVTMGDMWIKADKPSVKAGKVTIAAKNEGATMHGMAFAIAPVKAEGGMVAEDALAAKGKELAAGESETLTADLKPGKYELICFLPGHYAAGQKVAFEVK